MANLPVPKPQMFNPKTANINQCTYLDHYTRALVIVAARARPANEENAVNLVPQFARRKTMISAHLRALSLAFAEFGILKAGTG